MLEGLEQRWVPSTLTVTNNQDSGAGSLRAEIKAANNGDTIVFDPSLNGQTITLTTGELLIKKNLTISGPGAGQLTISGNNASREFEVASGMQVTLSGLTMSNGQGVIGGGILNNGTLTVSYCTLSANHANVPSTKTFNEGGGIDNFGALTVSNSTLSNNGTTGTGGGIKSSGNLTISNSSVLGNTGGGIDCGATTTISGSTVSQNSGGQGAGIINHSNGTMNLTGCTVSHNTATRGAGGIDNQGTLTISGGSTISDNTSPDSAGGIHNLNGTLTITGSSLLRNSGVNGGGVYTEGGRAVVNINGGSTLSNNSASGNGGGIYVYSGSLTVDGSTIGGSPSFANSAGLAGGGIYVNTYATVTVQNSSTITGNTAPVGSGADVYNQGTLYLDASSIIGILDGNQPKPI
jgi:parallel beta-helix repeat protein